MKKFLALMLIICICISVLAACTGDETFVKSNTEAQVSGGDTTATESTQAESGSESGGEENPEANAEQTFGGLQELKPLN